jgi:uncharacterized cofD-like protein
MKKNVVVMGGGTGTFPVISGLKHEDVQLSSIIAVSDSGGSTGRIRDEFGFQPVGDLRQALAALAEAENEEWIRKILLYRFEKGEGLQGHNLGNLILTALQDMTGDTGEALQIAERVFSLEGRVIPVTKDNVNLEIVYQDGSAVVGEHVLDQSADHPKKIQQVRLTPTAQVNPAAREALEKADMVVIGPGDYYASLMATLVPDGVKEAFQKTRAKIVYIVNLMTRLTQTDGMSAGAHVAGIEKAIGRKVDVIVLNSAIVRPEILRAYEKEHELPVQDDLDGDKRVVRADLLSDELTTKSKNDTAHRSLLRHDKEKIRQVLAELL